MFNVASKQWIVRRSRTNEPAGTAYRRWGRRLHRSRMYGRVMALAFLAAGLAPGQQVTKHNFTFVNAVDNIQGFSVFGAFPAINNEGTIAFPGKGTGFESGAVLKWQEGTLTTIATSADKVLANFGDSVVINSFGTVGFDGRVSANNDTIIATGDGGPVTIIASANEQGLVGGQFLGISAIDESGTVVFLGIRKGFQSRAIFAGRGGPLTPIVDTALDPTFSELGNSDIRASGNITFHGFPADGSEGIFSNVHGIRTIADTNNPAFQGFLDPVINNAGTVASAAFLNSGGVEVFTGTAAGLTPRTDPNDRSLTFVDNVSINNAGDVAFFATLADGRAGIFVEITGGSQPAPVIETGDPLFGSTVVALSVGRFSFNDSGRIAFRYQLKDGRTGIAVASRQL